MSEIEHERHRDFLVASIFMALIVTAVGAFAGLTVIFAWGISLLLVLCCALGAARDGGTGPFRWWLGAALACWLVLFSMIHALPNDPAQLFLGFTQATAAAVYGLWLMPLVLVTLPYALHFHRATMDEETLRRIEAMGAERKE